MSAWVLMTVTLTKAEFVNRARAKHGDRFDYSASEYSGFFSPIDVTCVEHGRCTTTPKSHLHTKSGGCFECLSRTISDNCRFTGDEFIERARGVHGDRYNYEYVEYIDSRTKVTLICSDHGPFRIRPNNHLRGQGCRACQYESLRRNCRLSFWYFVDRVIQTHGHKYDYELSDLVGQHSKISIHCPYHGVFRQTIGSHMLGSGCPKCASSNGEKRIRAALTSLGVEFDEEVRFARCRDKFFLPFDFFVPSHRLLIEFDGSQHYEVPESWGGEEKLAETQRHDRIKNRFADSQGYYLLRIPYWEIDNIENLVLEHLALTERVAS